MLQLESRQRKLKKGKMMKASMGSESKTRGVGSAIRGTNFKGVF
jgi:hypothetical protein